VLVASPIGFIEGDDDVRRSDSRQTCDRFATNDTMCHGVSADSDAARTNRHTGKRFVGMHNSSAWPVRFAAGAQRSVCGDAHRWTAPHISCAGHTANAGIGAGRRCSKRRRTDGKTAMRRM